MSNFISAVLENSLGRTALAVLSCIVFFVIFSVVMKIKKTKITIKMLSYSGICLALATVLSYVTLFKLPYGGSVTLLSMLFVMFIGYWFGPTIGIIGAVTFGILQLALNPYFVHPAQILLDYPMAFGALGIIGFFRNKGKLGFVFGIFVACVMRGLISAVSGYIFFSEFAYEGWNPIVYTLYYNLSYTVVEAVISIVAVSLPPFARAIAIVKTQCEASA